MLRGMINDLQDMTDSQLHELNSAIIVQLKFNRGRLAESARLTLRAGDKVKWSGRRGPMTGTIVRVKRKKAICDVGMGRNWDVPLGMLTVI